MFPLPLVVTVHPSRRLRVVVAILHLAACAALWLADLPVPAQLAGTGLIGASLALRQGPGRPVTLRLKAGRVLEIRAGDTWIASPAFTPLLLFPGLTLLRHVPAGASRPVHLAILPDSLPAEDFRCLRIWLKWMGRRSPPGDDQAGA